MTDNVLILNKINIICDAVKNAATYQELFPLIYRMMVLFSTEEPLRLIAQQLQREIDQYYKPVREEEAIIADKIYELRTKIANYLMAAPNAILEYPWIMSSDSMRPAADTVTIFEYSVHLKEEIRKLILSRNVSHIKFLHSLGILTPQNAIDDSKLLTLGYIPAKIEDFNCIKNVEYCGDFILLHQIASVSTAEAYIDAKESIRQRGLSQAHELVLDVVRVQVLKVLSQTQKNAEVEGFLPIYRYKVALYNMRILAAAALRKKRISTKNTFINLKLDATNNQLITPEGIIYQLSEKKQDRNLQNSVLQCFWNKDGTMCIATEQHPIHIDYIRGRVKEYIRNKSNVRKDDNDSIRKTIDRINLMVKEASGGLIKELIRTKPRSNLFRVG